MNALARAALLAGALSFALDAASDALAALCGRRGGRALFVLAGALLGGATLALVWDARPAAAGPRLLWLLLAALFLALLVGTVFIATAQGGSSGLPPAGDRLPLVDSGVYALCRHPGVLWLGGFYLALFLALGGAALLLAAVLFTALDALYVLWQDRCVFGRTIAGYAAYRRRTPFLLPTADSLRRCLRDLASRRGGRE